MEKDHRFAVLIDADNISDKYIKFILDEISNEGVATYKRIYGDWTKPALAAWKNVLLEYSITPIQQYGYTTGKNATDAAMIIDAMDILYSGNVEGFCLVTSDSDFTRLASRLRESGMDVVGMGEQKTPKAFIVACNKFKYLDILVKQQNMETEPAANAGEAAAADRPALPGLKSGGAVADPAAEVETDTPEAPEMTPLSTIRDSMLTILRENSDEDGWVFVGDVGTLLLKRHPDFDVRNFGYKKLTPFIDSLGDFELRFEQHGSSRLFYAREKEHAAEPVNASGSSNGSGGAVSPAKPKSRSKAPAAPRKTAVISDGKFDTGTKKSKSAASKSAASKSAAPAAGAVSGTGAKTARAAKSGQGRKRK